MRERDILLVEDNEFDAFLLNRAFQAAGIKDRIHVARDGQEAVDYLSGAGEFKDRNRYPLPTFVLLDLELPRMNGFDVLPGFDSKANLNASP